MPLRCTILYKGEATDMHTYVHAAAYRRCFYTVTDCVLTLQAQHAGGGECGWTGWANVQRKVDSEVTRAVLQPKGVYACTCVDIRLAWRQTLPQ